ncbi:A/G-specific adenine glycosylase [Spongiivirga citrea]|uniref:Adenine DNA glycosylase n=1 Tax=Spongiivirga citrea TaxID=1481457 RepID=A0A6M0CHY0_9FLAO|nr:A/G-specific adenine glycosylase [Spongiivirga citrea]NER17132.1 A/G-specific adenine glycosylase [Spongiivirga citrea]
MFSQHLIRWYSINKRDLPWRNTTHPYPIWLSEIILQQTRVEQGMPYYFKFLETFPTIFDLAKADESSILKLWQGLGYYSRARNLHATAKHIAFKLDGKFPETFEGLLKLKGVGHYTASAIGSICFDLPTPVVDGNVFRVLARYFGIDTPINSTQGIKEFRDLAETLIDKSQPATFNQAIMEFGATQCKPQNPYCLHCPFNESCVALQKNKIKDLPVKLKKTKVKQRYFNYLVFKTSSNESILNERTLKGIWQNLYEFPLIETETSINEEHLRSHDQFKNLIGANPFQIVLYNDKDIVHKLSHQHLHTKFWVVEIDTTPQETVPIDSLKTYAVPVLISNFLEEYNF